MVDGVLMICDDFFVCKQKKAYEMRISDWSSDVFSSDLPERRQLYAAQLYADLFAAPYRADPRPGADRADHRHGLHDDLPALCRRAFGPDRAAADVAFLAAWPAGRRSAALYADGDRAHEIGRAHV